MRTMSRITEMYLEEISEHLRKGRAVVMVGAGFSKNAVKTVATDKRFLDWNELANIFYKKIYGTTSDKGQDYYLDAVKLASIVESAFGRPVLDQLLLDYLPDEEYEPGELHKQLLSLNWADIFTTNYDTLLERTRKFVPNRRYQTVLCMEDLVYSSCPRIIKLHGSFPSYRPFVISKEDYRKYPKDCAVFVNTVQQAMIENIFCLIGFSGDDPNFLSWIGWIQDNLGSGYHSRIYLITLEKESRVEDILLSSRNIVVVNLFDLLKDGEISYQEGFQRFFKELQKRQRSSAQGKWIENTKGILLRELQDMKEHHEKEKVLKKLYSFWMDCRQSYPGWIIAPYKERIFLEKSLDDAEHYDVWKTLKENNDNPSEDEDFLSKEKFVQLYDWIRQVCLLPLTEKKRQLYEEILKMGGDSREKGALRLSLLTYYRRNGEEENFNNHKTELDKSNILTEEQKKQYRCELTMHSLYRCEYENLDRELAEWPLAVGNFSYELMHIGAMWEAEQYKQGLEMLVAMLDSIRSLGSNGKDLKVLSQEAYTLNLLNRAIPQIEFLSLNMRPITFSQGNRGELLKADSCDPEKEIELFQALLANSKTPESETELYHISVQFINFLERTGNFMVISPKLDYEKELKGAIRQIIKWNFYWGMILSIRTWDDCFIRQMAIRGSWCVESCEAERTAKHFCHVCRTHTFSVAAGVKLDEKGLRYRIWGEYLPIILGGFVHRCTIETRKDILELVGEMADIRENFEELSFLTKNLYRSLDGTFITEYADKLFDFIMKAKKEKRSEEVFELDFCDFMLYDMRAIKSKLLGDFCNKVDCLSKADREQIGVMCAEALLYHVGVLQETQKKQFVQDVVNKIAEKEFSLDFYNYVFDIVKEDENQKEAIKKQLLKKLDRLPVCLNPDSGECVFQVQLFEKMKRLFRQYNFVWTAEDVEIVLKRLYELFINKKTIKKNQYYLLFFNFYLLLIEILRETDWKILFGVGKTGKVDWIRQKYLEFTKEVLGEKNDFEKKRLIFSEMAGTDKECFVVAVCIFVKYLREDVGNWKQHLRELEINLASVVREQGVLAPFCIDIFRILVKEYKKWANEMDTGILRKILERVYDLETKSNFILIQKVYGAGLAYDCSLYMQEQPEIKACVEKRKNYVLREGVHTLIAKQWGIC